MIANHCTVWPMFSLLLIGLFFHTSEVLAQETQQTNKISTVGNCSPVVADTKGKVTLNINCPIYPSTRIQSRIRELVAVLKEDRRDFQPSFFRKGGPLWIDFEAKYHPFDNKFADTVLDELKQGKFSSIVGSSSGWRESFVKFLGWRMQKAGRQVYYTDVREWSDDDVPDLNWQVLDDEAAVIIFENVQYQPDLATQILYRLESQTTSLNAIFSFSSSLEITLESRPYLQHPLLSLPLHEIKAEKIATELVERYVAEHFNREVGPRITSAFVHRPNSYSSYFFSPQDLEKTPSVWYTAELLKSWDGRSVPDSGNAHKVGSSALAKELTSNLVRLGIAEASIVGAVALFSVFETPVPRAFFDERLGYSSREIDNAIIGGYIKPVNGGLMLDLPGAGQTLASFLLSVGDVELELRRRLKSADITGSLMAELLAFGVYDYGALLLNVSSHRSSPWKFDRDLLLASIGRDLASDTSPGRVGRTLLAMSQNRAFFSELDSSNGLDEIPRVRFLLDSAHRSDASKHRDELISMLERTHFLLARQAPLKEIAWLIIGVHTIDPLIIEQALMQFGREKIIRLIQAEDDIGKIASFLWALDRANHQYTTGVVADLGADWFVDRIKNDTSVERVGWLLEVLSISAPDVGARISSRLDVTSFPDVTANTPTRAIASLLRGLSELDNQKAKQLTELHDADDLRERLDLEADPLVRAMFILSLSRANPQSLSEVLDTFDSSKIQGWVDKANTPNEVGILLAGLKKSGSARAIVVARSTQSQFESEIDFYKSQVIKFSTMCAWCMEMAAIRLNSAERFSQEISYYVDLEAPNLRLDSSQISLQALEDIRKYEPHEFRRLIRTDLWDQLLGKYREADSQDRSRIAIYLYEADRTRFQNWAKHALEDAEIGILVLIDWFRLDEENASVFLESNYSDALALYVYNREARVENTTFGHSLRQISPDAFDQWVTSALKDLKHSPFSMDFIEQLKDNVSAPMAVWLAATSQINSETIGSFFYVASAEDLFQVFRLLSSRSPKLAHDMIRLGAMDGSLSTKVDSIIQALELIELSLNELHPYGDRVMIRGVELSSIRGNYDEISAAVPCSSIYGSETALTDQEAAIFEDILNNLGLFSRDLLLGVSSSRLWDCAESFFKLSPGLAKKFFEAMGHNLTLEVYRNLPGIAPKLLVIVEDSDADVGISLEETVNSALNADFVSGITMLSSIANSSEVAALEILAGWSNEQLLGVLSEQPITGAQAIIEALNSISQRRANEVLELLILSEWSLDAVLNFEESRYHLGMAEQFLLEIEKLDEALVGKVLSSITVETVEAGLLSASYWPIDFIERLAKDKPSILVESFSADVEKKLYDHTKPTSFVNYSNAAEMLSHVRRANPGAWQTLMERIDVRKVADSEKARRNTENTSSFYMEKFVEELARFDVSHVDMFLRRAPNALSVDYVRDLKKDFTVVFE